MDRVLLFKHLVESRSVQQTKVVLLEVSLVSSGHLGGKQAVEWVLLLKAVVEGLSFSESHDVVPLGLKAIVPCWRAVLLAQPFGCIDLQLAARTLETRGETGEASLGRILELTPQELRALLHIKRIPRCGLRGIVGRVLGCLV